ncbi:MAG: ABC transporter ATP-binding protein [Solirubrobacterales bacterium]
MSLEVRRGQSVGVIGPNGAGKSTLLRLASGLSRPTRGHLRASDDVASVLGLGTSLDLDLTGRENAFTAAIILGWSRSQANALMPAVLEFAELEEFADAPVRIYSEGMKLRLAFSVLAQLQPEVLVLDEVLAVGDLRFQEKCIERIREMRERGTALLLASHDLDQVAEECEVAVWLQEGQVRSFGDAPGVVAEYRESGRSATLARTPSGTARPSSGLEFHHNRFGSQELTVERVVLHGTDGRETDGVRSGESLSVSLELQAEAAPIKDPVVAVTLFRSHDDLLCYETSSEAGGIRLGEVGKDPVKVEVRFDRLDLVPGDYVLDVGAYKADWEFAYDFHWHAYPLRVDGLGGRGIFRPRDRWTVAR